MLVKNYVLGSNFTLKYKEALIQVKANDPNDKAYCDEESGTFTFWVQITVDQLGNELTDNHHFVARPCPPFCCAGIS